MKKVLLTAHMIVKNEENWIWYAIKSLLPEVEQFFIFDTGSTDQTTKLIKMVESSKIVFEEKGDADPKRMIKLRNEMLERTKTDWFILVDGDEVWNTGTLKRLRKYISDVEKNILGVVMRTRNCVGDVYHYLPEGSGRYSLLGRKGHLTIRVYRVVPDYSWKGTYPWESYTDKKGTSLNDRPEHLKFFDGFYWHMTHLSRSSSPEKTIGFRRKKYETGLSVEGNQDFPEVLLRKHPLALFNPLRKRDRKYELAASIITPLKHIKRRMIDV